MTPTISLPPRYDLLRLLGEGGMGQVFLVHDREREATLALKRLLPAVDAAGTGDDGADPRFLFRQEYGAMVSLRHPGLVAAYDYGELDDGTPYFTMEAVAGKDLDGGLQTEAEIRAWLPGVAAGLAYLHGRGFVHGDLKPENLRLGEDGAPKLMDLGLLTRTGRAAGAIRGSVFYMAPEVIQLGALDGRTDLYALGAVLYHLLAGRPPFEHPNTLALLRMHLDAPPVPIAGLVPGLSPALAAAVTALLAKDPARRPASAAALLAMLDLPAVEPQGAALLGSPIHGRGAIQARLDGLLAAGGAAALVGPAGSGKSRLLEETRAKAQLAGLATLQVAGQGADAPPYAAVRPLLRALVGAPSPARDRLAPILVKLAPELDVPQAPPLEGAAERTRLHGALVELAHAQVCEALWLVDDADKLDPASTELLAALRRQGAERPWRWLAAGADAPAGDEALPLGALDQAAVGAIAAAMLGQPDLPAGLDERLHVLGGGLPGTIEVLLAHWIRTGVLHHDGARWATGAAEAFDLPGGLDVLLDDRLQALDEAALRTARAAAALGATAELALLAGLVGLDEANYFATFATLEAEELLARDQQAYRFVRPIQAEALAAGLPEAERRRLASAAAAWLQARHPAQPDDARLPLGEVLRTARYLLAGEAPKAALPWVEAGARRAIGLFALDAASTLLEAGLALNALSDAERLPLQVLLADARRHQARSDDALALIEGEQLLTRLEAAGALALPRETNSYGILLMTKARYDDARAALERAIALADAARDPAELARAHRFAGRTAYFAGRKDAARAHLAAAIATARDHDLELPLAAALGFYGYLLASGDEARAAEGLTMLDEAVAINRRLGNAVDLTDALVSQGSVLLARGQLADAQALFEEVLANAERLGITVTGMTARLNLAAVALERGELGAAGHHAGLVASLGRGLGRKFYQAYGGALAGLAEVLGGAPAAGLAQLDHALAIASEMGNKVLELAVRVARVEALVNVGRPDDALDELAIARALAQAAGTHEHDEKLARCEALAFLRDALSGPERLVEAPASLLALPAAAGSAIARQALLDRFARLTEAATAHGEAAVAHARRWWATALVYMGEPDPALAQLDAARPLAVARGLRGLVAEIDALAGWVRAARGLPDGRALIAAALAEAQATGAAPLALWAEAALAELDRDHRARRKTTTKMRALAAGLADTDEEAYMTWLERALAGRTAPSGANPGDARLREVLDLAMRLDPLAGRDNVVRGALTTLAEFTGAERAFLLLYEDAEVRHRAYYGMSASDSEEFSTTLADQVYWSGQPFFIEDAQADAHLNQQKSVMALALRTMFGLPLRDRGEVIGVLLADSRRVNPDFTPADLDLGLALADQVARTIQVASELERADAAVVGGDRMFDVALATAGASDLAGFVAPIAQEALALTGADACYVVTGPGLDVRAAYDRAGAALSTADVQLSTSVCSWVLSQGESLYLPDASSAEAFQHQKSVMALALRMVWAVPITDGEARLGVLYLPSQRVGREDPEVLDALVRLGRMVGAFLARKGG